MARLNEKTLLISKKDYGFWQGILGLVNQYERLKAYGERAFDMDKFEMQVKMILEEIYTPKELESITVRIGELKADILEARVKRLERKAMLDHTEGGND